MAEKFDDLGERSRPEARAESGNRPATRFAASILALAGMVLVFDIDEDEDDSGPPEES